MSIMRLVVFVMTLLPLLACSWSMSPERSRRISECLRRCDSQYPDQAGQGDPNGDDRSQTTGALDPRSACERRCHTTP